MPGELTNPLLAQQHWITLREILFVARSISAGRA